jgi:hypothetical protein
MSRTRAKFRISPFRDVIMELSERPTVDAQAVGIARSFHTVTRKYSDRLLPLWDEMPVNDQAQLVGTIKMLLLLEVIDPGRNAISRLPFVNPF